MKFENPQWLWLFLIIPLLIAYYIYKLKYKKSNFKVASFAHFDTGVSSIKTKLIHVPFALRTLCLSLLILALARPQSNLSWQNITTEGIDMIVAMDVSLSMLAQDLKPTRIEASKAVAVDFVDSRPNDRIGLVIFSGEGFTQCPLTTDHTVLKNLFEQVKCGMLADGTAIGMGLATAVNRIKDSEAKSKVIILLTDGENNAGNIAPETAADIAKAFGVRVYTIGVGTKGMAYSPVGVYPNGQYVFDYVPVSIDEPLLTKIAKSTGGKYFRATSNKSLKGIYAEIDKLEKTRIEVTEFRKKNEHFWPLLLIACVVFGLEILLKSLVTKVNL